MALAHERIAPCHHPNKFAFANVKMKAGSGAATDWKIMRKNDTTAAHTPYDAMNSRISVKSPVEKRRQRSFTNEFTLGTAK